MDIKLLKDLEKILIYKMTLEEAKAYKLALMWTRLTTKYLPEDKHCKLPKGDPRKSFIFKICWKLLRETRGILRENDYKNYFIAQIQSLNQINDSGKRANVDSNVIVGEKAWLRWKYWKKNYDKSVLSQMVAPTNEDYTISELVRVKQFFIKIYAENGPNYTIEQAKEWLEAGEITPTYILLSPYMSKICPDKSIFGFDLPLYKNRVTKKILTFFAEEFKNELL